MAKWFESQNLLIKVILLLIPFVNWIVELVVRWSSVLSSKNVLNLVAAILVTVFGVVIGWLDIIWVIFTGHMILAKA